MLTVKDFPFSVSLFSWPGSVSLLSGSPLSNYSIVLYCIGKFFRPFLGTVSCEVFRGEFLQVKIPKATMSCTGSYTDRFPVLSPELRPTLVDPGCQ